MASTATELTTAIEGVFTDLRRTRAMGGGMRVLRNLGKERLRRSGLKEGGLLRYRSDARS